MEVESSKETLVDSGVPQGTVLGPIMFLCHINYLPDRVTGCVNSSVCLSVYLPTIAYYTERSERKRTTSHSLQAYLKHLEERADKWGMRFNTKKCYVLSINNKSSRYYQLEKHTLQEVQDNPYLGLQISNDLKWNIHINNVCKKANATLGFLRRNLRNVPESCRKTAYVTLVRSIMEYGATIWNPYLKRDIIQNRFVKKDYKSRETGAITRMREDLELETLLRGKTTDPDVQGG